MPKLIDQGLTPLPFRMNYYVGDASGVCFFGSIRYCVFLAEKVISKKFFNRPLCEIGMPSRQPLFAGLAILKFWIEFDYFGRVKEQG